MKIDIDLCILAEASIIITLIMVLIASGIVIGEYSLGKDVCQYAGMTYGTIKEGHLWCLDKSDNHELMVRLT